MMMSITKSLKDNGLISLMEGRTFIVGREGHIYIDSPSASKQHAEIRVINGRVFLRDLNSTNGTFLVKNRGMVHFDKGYVNPLQPVVIGDQRHTILDLLTIASDFASTDDSPTQVNFSRRTANSRG
jgi:pSer/pThr/pTyr-binding forkhead associated (FHA) protein